jgi:tRNA pseudouridine55 synthase
MTDSSFNFVEGAILLIDKPYTWTSFDVVKKVRNKVGIKKVGHAGTLDPLATGLLIICTGKKTKEIDTYQAQEKEYTGTFELGKITASYDAETEAVDHQSIDHLREDEILSATKPFIGEITQYPPAHSAVKIDGKRAYEMARAGQEVAMKSRQVTVSEFEITKIDLPQVHFRVVCSKGTYIRSLANDFGKQLGVGAYLTSLCRTRIGNFNLKDAWQLDDLIQKIEELKKA